MKYFLQLSLLLTLVGCGEWGLRGPQEHVYSMDGVKLIDSDITDDQDPSSFLQEKYEINSKRRLLLRFEKLSEHTNKIDVSDSNRVYLEIVLLKYSSQSFQSLRICSVTRQWMMRATWKLAHPFGQSGRWQREGGDYEEADCVVGQRKAEEHGTGLLQYDVTPWFKNYAKGRDQNYGLILINVGESLEIAGDKSGSFSPRIQFMK